MKMKNKITIGLTGGIASGKSSVLKDFKRLGARVLDCDRMAREVVRPGQPALRKIRKAFGKEVLLKNGSLNRPAMAKIVFKSRPKRKKLEKIIHPEVVRLLKKRMACIPSGLVVADVPLLFESGLERMFDKTLVVWTPLKTQLARLMDRSGMSKGEALSRINAQWPLARKRKMADFTLDNSGFWADSRSQTVSLAKKWMN